MPALANSTRTASFALVFTAISALLLSGLSTAARAADYTIDKDHSHVGFTIRHLVGEVPGSFKDFAGDFSFDEKKPENAKVKVTVQTASVNTDNEKRDSHLKSPDFFDVQKFPTMTFESTQVTAEGDKKFKVTGNFTLRGVTKPETFNVTYAGTAKDPWGNTRVGFIATSKINRKDFGMVWNKVLDAGGAMLGDEVEIKLNIEAIQKAGADKAKK